uniref:Uncharacterized protein n=2 Tax=Setaria TaxID=4554 RepID=K4APA0_SETIT|nr:hypothetical protein SEVIR_9G238950v2 [Setaria viridis]
MHSCMLCLLSSSGVDVCHLLTLLGGRTVLSSTRRRRAPAPAPAGFCLYYCFSDNIGSIT